MSAGRRIPLAAAAALAVFSGCGRERGRSDIDAEVVQARFGIGGEFDADRWNLLTLRLINPGEDFRGTVEVEGIVGVPTPESSERT